MVLLDGNGGSIGARCNGWRAVGEAIRGAEADWHWAGILDPTPQGHHFAPLLRAHKRTGTALPDHSFANVPHIHAPLTPAEASSASGPANTHLDTLPPPRRERFLLLCNPPSSWPPLHIPPFFPARREAQGLQRAILARSTRTAIATTSAARSQKLEASKLSAGHRIPSRTAASPLPLDSYDDAMLGAIS